VDEVEAPVLPSKPKSLPTRHGAVTGVPGLSQLVMYRFVGLFYWGYAILCGLSLIAATAASIVLYKSPAMAVGFFVGGLFVYVVQLVALRCVVELVVVLFKMYDTLLELRDLNQQLLKR
jgi:membrane-associated HD superfamily phosphohydrolase